MNASQRRRFGLMVGVALAGAAAGQGVVTEEISTGFLPLEWVNAAMRKALSPQGRATMAGATGPVRVVDAADRISAARQAIADLMRAPALVPIEITFATMAQRIVQRLPAEPPVVNYGIPVPDRYDPPRIVGGPGGVAVVPAHPRNFTTRSVGPGTVVNPSPTGYQTLTPDVRVRDLDAAATATVSQPAGARRLSASTVLGKAVSATVLRHVPDPAALRALAVKHGAVAEGEPAWALAGTELMLTPEASGAAVVVKVVPQIVLPAAVAGAAPRRVPIMACAAGVMIAPGAASQMGTLPKTDPEFYRVFLGAAQAVDGTFTAMTVSAGVKYIGSPPP